MIRRSRTAVTARGRIAAVIFAALAALVACADTAPQAELETVEAEAPAPASAPTVPPGKQLYDANCAACHGEGGLGDGPAAVGLTVAPTNIREHFGEHAFDEIVQHVVEGIPPAMPPAPINTDEVRDVLTYVWSQIPDTAQARLRAALELAAEEH